MARPRHLPKFLDQAQTEQLLGAAARSSPRDSAILLSMAKAGLRVSEVCKLRWEHVGDGQLWVREGKGQKDRVLPLHWRLAAALAYLRNPPDPLISGSSCDGSADRQSG
jgi:integrase